MARRCAHARIFLLNKDPSGLTPVDPFVRYRLNEDAEHGKSDASENERLRCFGAASADYYTNRYTTKYTNRLRYRIAQ